MTITIEGWLVRQTELAILVDVDETADIGGGEFWFPKAEVEWHENNDGTVEVDVPEWLAKRKGMI